MTAGRVDQDPTVATEPVRPAGPPPVPDGDRGRPGGWVLAHWKSLALLAALLVVVGVVHAVGMGGAPQRVDDEGTYVAQAWAVLHRHTLAHYTYWYDHPPLGWLLLAAWTGITGGFSRAANAVAAGREFMLVTQLVSAGLLYGLARRLELRRPAAAAAVLLFAASPLALSFHRAVYLDNVATPLVLAAFLLALSPRHRLAAHAAGSLAMAAAVLAKETSLLLLPALLWQYWQVSDWRTRRYSVALTASLFVLVVSAYVLYALLRGELLPGPEHVSLFDAVRFQLAGRAPSGNPFDPGSPAHRTIAGWLGLDPWLLGAAVVLVPAGLAIRRLRPVTAAFAILAAMALPPGYLPVPLVIPMLPFASLLLAGVADAAWGTAAHPRHLAGAGGTAPRPQAARPLLVAGVLLLAAALAVPGWVQRDRDLMTVDHDAPFRQAEAWIGARVAGDARLLVDDAVWVDLVSQGRPAERVVWFYKLDTDRDVKARYPRGWRDFHYVMSTPSMRGFPDSLPQVAQAMRHSRVVASFGRGPGRVEVRRVQTAPA
jgi:hypothetical protein